MKIAILGAGSWGTALACLLSQDNKVLLWTRDETIKEEINISKTNKKYCADKIIHENVHSVCDIDSIKDCDVFFFSVPAKAIRQVGEQLTSYIKENIPLVVCAKGIENSSLSFPYQIIQELFPKNPITVLSGPNFAGEVMEQKPAATDIASTDCATANLIAGLLRRKNFGVNIAKDIISVQIAGIMKNIIAIGCGMAIGSIGENARAITFNKGFQEIITICKAMNGNIDSLLGLSGMGDLFLTCASLTSRNTKLGWNLVNNNSTLLPSMLSEGKMSAEGIIKLTKKLKITLPLSEFIANIVMNEKDFSKEEYSSLLLKI